MSGENKTRKTQQDVGAFIDRIENLERREECRALMVLFGKVTEEEPRMWGDRIIGFGQFHYVYASGREGDWMLTGFSPTKRHLTLYLMSGFRGMEELLERLGPYRRGKSCLYINHLRDVDLKVLEEMIAGSVEAVRRGEIHYE